MALGAHADLQVVLLILGGATRPVLAGLIAGLALSLVVTPLLRRALSGMSPFDPIAYLEIAAILLASSLAATWIPAVRATPVEPAITLRGDKNHRWDSRAAADPGRSILVTALADTSTVPSRPH